MQDIPISLLIQDLLRRLESRNGKPATRTNNGWQALCPAHDDHTPSLSITEGDAGRVLVKCFAGCTAAAVCGALGLKTSDLMAEAAPKHNCKRIVATYPYHDETGQLLFEVVRYEPKDFRQRRPDGKGGRLWNMDGVRRVLYRLPQVKTAMAAGEQVFICEGEKDVAALGKAGYCGTCNSGGAGKWLAQYNAVLTGADVVIIADRDQPGRNHAAQVAASLHGNAGCVRVVELPDIDGKPVKDVADYFAAGGQAADFWELCQAAPIWTPSATAKVETADGTDDIAAEIRGAIIAILTDGNMSTLQQRQQISAAVVGGLSKIGTFYFHATLRDFKSALFFNRQTKRLENIGSDAFSAWLSSLIKVNRAEALFKSIFAEVQTAALASPLTSGIEPQSFWASRPQAIYLSNGDGQLVKITAQSFTLADNGTDGVLFAAGRTLPPWKLVVPKDPFTASVFANGSYLANHGKDLLQLWVYSFSTNPKSKPPVCISGDVRSGKTRTAKAIAELYGLPFIASKVEENGEDDFWPGMDAGGLFTLDNADTRVRWLVDALANAATDGCAQRRKKYTDADQVILRARAWLCVTSANPSFASDAGLADRLLVIRLGRREGTTSDTALSDEIAAIRDAGLSHIVATLSKALADTSPTPDNLNARHPDFAAFAVKIGRALGRESEALAALRAAEEDKSAFCLENDSIGAALISFINNAKHFTGTANELAQKLQAIDSELCQGNLTAKRLGKRMVTLWPHIAKAFAIALKEVNRSGITIFTFETAPDAGCAGFKTVIS
ncbi:MAG: hypothetical protein WCO56_19075 [Verrucomicrobiota bacterium]